jgi:hypothetical protein
MGEKGAGGSEGAPAYPSQVILSIEHLGTGAAADHALAFVAFNFLRSP